MFNRMFRWVALGLTIIALIALVGCSGESEDTTTQDTGTESSGQPQDTTPSEEPPATSETSPSTAPEGMADVTELKVEDTLVGTGAEATAGKTVTVHYTGWLVDGTKFDSSLDAGQPYQFVLGQGMVIQGWDQGVQGMKVGGKRRLTIPSAMGYGEQGAGGVIPPNATLVFDVELLDVQ